MSYDVALDKAWNKVKELSNEKLLSMKFLSDEYSIDIENRKVLSLSCNAPAKEYYTILILHFLAEKLVGLPNLSAEWISFQELSGGQGYFAAFKKRAIEPIIRKYGKNPDSLLEIIERFPAKTVKLGDASVVIEAFEKVPVLITFWRGDEEFGPEANILFDKNIQKIFCTEDIAVLSGIIANQI
jgi:hypothetical protein